MSNSLTSQGFSSRPFQAWATGKTINATKGSRTNITTAVQEGYVLVQDPYGFDNLDQLGNPKHIDFTQPQTSFLHMLKVLIVGVHPDTNTELAAGRGGWVEIVEIDRQADCMLAESAAVGDVMAVANGSYTLTAATVFAATNLATFKTLGAKCAIVLTAFTYVATTTRVRCNFNGGGIV